MKRVLLCGLVGLGLAVGFAGGQAPPDPKPKVELTAEVKLDAGKKTLEEAIAAAMKNNPDVRVAEAEVQVAQAKLAQAKLAVAQKVAAAHAAIDRAKADTTAAEAQLARDEALVKKGFAPVSAAEAARQKLEAAKSATAKAEAEYNALLGVMPGQAAIQLLDLQVGELTIQPRLVESTIVLGGVTTEGTLFLNVAKPAPGSVADKLREVLDKPVKLNGVGSNLSTFLEWLNAEAKLELTFRVRLAGSDVTVHPTQGTLSVGAVLQMIEDDNAARGLRFVIREYGILATDAKTLPSGAVTVQEFWKQLRAEKAKAAKEKAEPKK